MNNSFALSKQRFLSSNDSFFSVELFFVPKVRPMLRLKSIKYIVHKTFSLCEYRKIHTRRKCTCMKTKKRSTIAPPINSTSGTTEPLATEQEYRKAFERFAPAFSFQTTCHRDKLYYLMLHVLSCRVHHSL